MKYWSHVLPHENLCGTPHHVIRISICAPHICWLVSCQIKDLNKICLLCYHSWNKEWWRFSSESSSFGGRRKGLEAPPRVVESSSSVRGRRRRWAQGPPSNQTHFHPFLLLTWDKRTTTCRPWTSEVMWISATFYKKSYSWTAGLFSFLMVL